jgi:hypothetical protein
VLYTSKAVVPVVAAVLFVVCCDFCSAMFRDNEQLLMISVCALAAAVYKPH